MSYQIEVPPPVRKEIKALPGYVRAEARSVIRGLATNPYPSGAKELRNKPNIYRLWLATHWRMAYIVDEGFKHVRILRVRLKKYMDYDSL